MRRDAIPFCWIWKKSSIGWRNWIKGVMMEKWMMVSMGKYRELALRKRIWKKRLGGPEVEDDEDDEDEEDGMYED